MNTATASQLNVDLKHARAALPMPGTLKSPTYYGIVIDSGRNGFDPKKGIEPTMAVSEWSGRYEMKRGHDWSSRPIKNGCSTGSSGGTNVPFWTSFCYRPMFEIPEEYWSYHDRSSDARRHSNELMEWLIRELGGEELAEFPLSVMYALIPPGSPGKKYHGPLDTHGSANIFFLRDSEGTLVPHDLHWDNSGWHIWEFSLPLSVEWGSDGLDAYDFYSHGRIFSRPRSLLHARDVQLLWA